MWLELYEQVHCPFKNMYTAFNESNNWEILGSDTASETQWYRPGTNYFRD